MTNNDIRQFLMGLAIAVLVLVPGLAAHAEARQIDWNEARHQGDLADRANIVRPANQPMSALASVNVPVLLPALTGSVLTHAGGETGLMFFPRGNLYSASFHYDGVDVSVSGAAGAIATNAPDDWTRTEYGQSLNFSRFGGAYIIEVRCSDPTRGGNCTDAAFIRQIRARLVVAGGSGL